MNVFLSFWKWKWMRERWKKEEEKRKNLPHTLVGHLKYEYLIGRHTHGKWNEKHEI